MPALIPAHTHQMGERIINDCNYGNGLDKCPTKLNHSSKNQLFQNGISFEYS